MVYVDTHLCMPITRMRYLYNLPDIVPVHLFTASPLTSQQMVFIHPITTPEFACTFFTSKVALPRSTPQMVQPVAQPHAPYSGVRDVYQTVSIGCPLLPRTSPCRSWQNTTSDARFHRIASRSAIVEQNFDTPNQALFQHTDM